MTQPYIKRVLIIIIISFLFVAFPKNLYADRPGQSLIDVGTNLFNFLYDTGKNLSDFLKDLAKQLEFTSRVSTQYDNNIFLEEDDEDSDLKTTIYQGFLLKSPKDSKKPIYYQFDYGINYDSYLEEGDHILSHYANALLSYRPFDKLSLGISDNFQKVGKGIVTTALGDRLVTLGYYQNTANFQAKYDVTKNTYLDFIYGYYRLDVMDPSRDEFIDRNTDEVNLSLNRNFNPNISGYIGNIFQKVRFDETLVKNSDGNRLFLGLAKKFPNKLKLTTEVGYEIKDIETQRKDHNLDFRISANSLFSAYTKLYFLVEIDRLQPSSRTEYSQYSRRNVVFQLEHYLTPKLILITNLGFERQLFKDEDSISSSVTTDSTTKIYSAGSTLRKILNDWLSADLGYSFTKRDSEFRTESYDDHKVTFGLTANY